MDVKKTFKPTDTKSDAEIHVAFEDQQDINEFARNNSKLLECKTELKEHQAQLQNLADVEDELLLMGDADSVPVRIGEVFWWYSSDEVNDIVTQRKTDLESRVADLDLRIHSHVDVQNTLKSRLYAKFGNNIHLESDD